MTCRRWLAVLGVGVWGLSLTLGCDGGQDDKKPSAAQPAPAKTPADVAPAKAEGEAKPAQEQSMEAAMAEGAKQMEAAVDAMLPAVKKPVSKADVQKLLKIWPEAEKTGGLAELKKKDTPPTVGAAVKEIEGKPALKAAITGGGMSVQDFVEKALAAQLAASITQQGGVARLEAQVAEMEKQVAAADKAPKEGQEAAAAMGAAMMKAMMPMMKSMLKLSQAIPPETFEAVKPHVAEILKLSGDTEGEGPAEDSDQE